LACINAARVVRLREIVDDLIAPEPRYGWPKKEDWLREIGLIAKRELEEADPAVKPKLPETKTVASLWELHGIDSYSRGAWENGFPLLEYWIDTLYGQRVARELDLAKQIEEHEARRAAAEKNSVQDIHIMRMPKLTIAVRRASMQLLPYNDL